MGKKRILVILTLVILLSLLLVGCAQKPREEGRYVEYPLRSAVLIKGQYRVNFLKLDPATSCWMGVDTKFEEINTTRIFSCEEGAKLRDYGNGANPRFTICALKGWVQGE